jgi:uncharacterized SAM-binding protein YcdF (DUF218 family)
VIGLLTRLALQPLTQVLVLLAVLLTLLVRRRRAGFRAPALLCLAALLILGASSCRPLSAGLLELLERGQVPLDTSAQGEPDAILVLGGGFRERITPRPVLSDASKERFLEGLRLARAYPGAELVFSGGTLDSTRQTVASVMAELAAAAGVEGERIVAETRARDTRGNAIELARLARERGWRRTAVVTSAYHMPRALATLRRAGIDGQPAPCDFTGAGPASLAWLVPESQALRYTEAFLHEVVGRAWYRLRGWA